MNLVGILLMFDSLGGCWVCDPGDSNYENIWTLFQTAAFCLYNCGFAAIQVSHLSLVATSSADYNNKN